MNSHSTTNLSVIDRRRFLILGGAAGSLLLSGRVAPAWKDSAAGLLVHTETPMNAEPSLDKLIQSYRTPTEHFYIRSHAPVPQVDVKSFRLQVGGMVEKPFEISLDQLKNDFSKQSVVATMTCAGNRRSEHSLVKEVSGVPWQAGAIGNAQWGGAKLSDLLQKAGVQSGAKHVWFEGVDQIDHKGAIIPFGASIPLEKALDDREQTPGALVAYEMNEAALEPHHGFPMRTVVPGYIGARSVKWLGKIVVSDRPSPNHYVATAYKLVTEGTDDEWSAAEPLETFAINSVICSPATGSKVKPGQVKVSGYALPPGLAGRTIRRVELSSDGGKSWTPARLTTPAEAFCWRLWEGAVTINADTEQITVRATDSSGQVQPETVAWNLKGYMFNAWHSVKVD